MAVMEAKVSAGALLKRINRKLAREGQKLKATRGERCRIDLGDHYVTDVCRNILVLHHVNPAALGRKLGVLQEWEVVCN